MRGGWRRSELHWRPERGRPDSARVRWIGVDYGPEIHIGREGGSLPNVDVCGRGHEVTRTPAKGLALAAAASLMDPAAARDDLSKS